MKRIIRGILADLGKKRKDYTPPVPAAPTKGKLTEMDQMPPATLPDDLDNQDLSDDASEQVRQLDYQAERLIEKGTELG